MLSLLQMSLEWLQFEHVLSLLQSETDVLYLRMIGVNMQSAMQCVCGWMGRQRDDHGV